MDPERMSVLPPCCQSDPPDWDHILNWSLHPMEPVFDYDLLEQELPEDFPEEHGQPLRMEDAACTCGAMPADGTWWWAPGEALAHQRDAH